MMILTLLIIFIYLNLTINLFYQKIFEKNFFINNRSSIFYFVFLSLFAFLINFDPKFYLIFFVLFLTLYSFYAKLFLISVLNIYYFFYRKNSKTKKFVAEIQSSNLKLFLITWNKNYLYFCYMFVFILFGFRLVILIDLCLKFLNLILIKLKPFVFDFLVVKDFGNISYDILPSGKVKIDKYLNTLLFDCHYDLDYIDPCKDFVKVLK